MLNTNPSWLLLQSSIRVVWARLQGLVDFIGFHPLDKAIYAKIWLIILCDFLIPNFMKLFQCSREIDTKVMDMREVCLTLFKHTFEKSHHVGKGVLSKFKLELLLYIWSWHLHYHLTCHVWAQTHCLTGDKHLGCYSPPPLKESRPEIQDERLLWKRDMLPVSNISDSFMLHSIQASEGPNLSR